MATPVIAHWQALQSSNLQAMAYDHERSILMIRFKSGDVYQYQDVEAEVADELARAPSPGAYFYSAIRDAYPFERV